MRWTITDDIYAETWRQLLEYSNIELTTDIIIKKHGEAKSKSHSENIAKQAAQARVCVLQAKEYFDAARSASLFTAPNHYYYGAISLASLMMLILGDGTKSLDYLRRDNKNCHHGLDFITDCSGKTASIGIELIQRSRSEILKFGHFSNWYRVLPSRGSVFATHEKISESTKMTNITTIGYYDAPSFEKISGVKISLIDLLKFLPDLDVDLNRFGINVVRSRTSHNVSINKDGLTTHAWRIHGCRSKNELDILLEEFCVESKLIDAVKFDSQNEFSGIVYISYYEKDNCRFRWPNSRSTMNHDSISYAGMLETHEICDLYLVAYQLSMLSRYFPDIWVKCIESQCKSAKIIERASEIIIKKFPILTLSALNGVETVISTHRQPWKDY